MILYKHYSKLPVDLITEFLTKPNLRFCCASELNDPLEGILSFKISTELKKDLDKHNEAHKFNSVFKFLKSETPKEFFICSFNKAPLNPLMWSHYAQSHQGFMIEYDLNEFHGIQMVDYLEKPNVVEFSRNFMKALNQTNTMNQMSNSHIKDFTQKFQDNLATKPVCWFYENEYRIIRAKEKFNEYINEKHSYITKGTIQECENIRCANEVCTEDSCPNNKLFFHELIDKSYIKSIIFGVNTPKEYIEIIERIKREHSLSIQIYKAEFIEDSYNLIVPNHPILGIPPIDKKAP